MFDPHSQLRAQAFLHDKPPTTWQEMVRQNRDRDVDPHLYRVHARNLLSVLIASLSAYFHRWQTNLLSHGSDRKVQHKRRHFMPMAIFPVDRKTPRHPGKG